jgi:hypothetical protein
MYMKFQLIGLKKQAHVNDPEVNARELFNEYQIKA